MADVRFMSATALAAKIRRGELSSRDVVEAHIGHLHRVNPAINAVVETCFERARAEADAADTRRGQVPAHELPPLHGVPCTIKECIAVEGMPNTAGLVRRKGRRTHQDATVVARLRRAGAIPLGVTNTSELCMWMETNNNVYGRTHNPYNVRHTVGGSSGGEGAIVASGASPFGVGSDIGGSIRLPAFFNGVFGHKPSGGLVPGTGQYPMPSEGPALRYLTTGPITRRAEDLMPLLQVLAGPDGADSGCQPMPLGDPATIDIEGLTVVTVEDNSNVPVHPHLRAAQYRAARALEMRGARVKQAKVHNLKYGFDIWASMMAQANDVSFRQLLEEYGKVSPGYELLKWSVRRSEFTAMAMLLSIAEDLVKLVPGRVERFVRMGHALREELTDLIGERGIMLFPTYTKPAPRHNRPFVEQLMLGFDYAYTAVINPTELPVTQVPCGLSADGLPLGFQVIGIHGHDHVTIAAAMALENIFGGWVPPKALH